jgi:hypothetical protein
MSDRTRRTIRHDEAGDRTVSREAYAAEIAKTREQRPHLSRCKWGSGRIGLHSSGIDDFPSACGLAAVGFWPYALEQVTVAGQIVAKTIKSARQVAISAG